MYRGLVSPFNALQYSTLLIIYSVLQNPIPLLQFFGLQYLV
jgi:hypothetical protein